MYQPPQQQHKPESYPPQDVVVVQRRKKGHGVEFDDDSSTISKITNPSTIDQPSYVSYRAAHSHALSYNSNIEEGSRRTRPAPSFRSPASCKWSRGPQRGVEADNDAKGRISSSMQHLPGERITAWCRSSFQEADDTRDILTASNSSAPTPSTSAPESLGIDAGNDDNNEGTHAASKSSTTTSSTVPSMQSPAFNSGHGDSNSNDAV